MLWYLCSGVWEITMAIAARLPQLDTLLLSRDDQTIRTFQPLVEVAGLNAHVCTNAEIALEMLARWRFDAVFVDCESIPEAMSLISALRCSPSNRTSVVFALVHQARPADAFRTGATFVLDKSSGAERARIALRAAYGLMLLGRRRYHRRPALVEATYRSLSTGMHRLVTFNISEGGVGVEGNWEPRVGDRGTVEFHLPAGAGHIRASVEIAWAEGRRAGLTFSFLTPDARRSLEEWTLEGLTTDLPVAVASC
jgi:PilZ domain-containing protein